MGAHYERARLLSIQGRYAQAERELREDLAENPHNGQAHAFLGRCLAQQKRLKEAVVECEEGVHLAPHLAYAHYMLALTYDDCGRLGDAENALREALRLEPHNVGQLQWLSWVQYRRGERRAALDTADRGLEIDPQHVSCLNSRGQYLRALGGGGWKESEIAIRAALALSPENAFTHANLGWTLWSKAHALSRYPAIVQPWFVGLRSETRESHKHFLEALRLDPTSDWAKTGASETLVTRWTAVVQYALVLIVLIAALVGWWANDAASKPDSNAPVPSLVILLIGGLTIVFAKGPVYLTTSWTRVGPAVLSPARRLAARATAVCLTLAAAAGLVALFTPPPAAVAVLFLGLIMVRPLTVAIEAEPGPVQRGMWVYALVLIVAGMTLAVGMSLSSERPRSNLTVILLVGGFLGSCFSGKIARDLTNQWGKRP